MSLIKSSWNAVKSTCKIHAGAILAAIATVVWAVGVGAINLESGFGLPADLLLLAAVALAGVPLLALAIALVLTLLRLLPRLLTGFLLAAGFFISLLWFSMPGNVGAIMAALLLLVECTFGASLATIMRGNLRHSSPCIRVATYSILLFAVIANFGMFRFLRSDGIDRDGMDEELRQVNRKQASLRPPLNLPNPSTPGPYRVKTLCYGSGTSLRRPEFGPSVAIHTDSVDASPFFKDFIGWKAWIRKRYWGFGLDKLPLNATVFYPNGLGPFPLFMLVHGNHQMSVPSDKGYAYLCELLASRGFIAVSVDENFLNSGLFHDLPRQQAARAWLLLEHLRLWHAWAKDSRSPFFGKADLSRIALAGHSRGGEAAATAALFNKLAYDPDDANIKFNYGYAIKSVIAIAPEDGQYKPAEQWRVLQDVNYLTLQGANDFEVPSFLGSRQYDHVRFSDRIPAFKTELYIYRANHGQFNTLWGRADANAPESWFLNLRPLLAGEAQRQIAKTYISAFLAATLLGQSGYSDLFRDYRRGRMWLPDTLYVNRFQDQSYQAICSFDEDADLTTTTVPGGHIAATGLTLWREGNIPFRDGSREYNGVFLGWNSKEASGASARAPNYSVEFPEIQGAQALDLSVAVIDDDDGNEVPGITDFSVEAESANGVRASLPATSFAPLLPPLAVRFAKLEQLERYDPSEPVFQTLEIPFSVFARTNTAFDSSHVRCIRLIFDKTPARNIVISGIGVSGIGLPDHAGLPK